MPTVADVLVIVEIVFFTVVAIGLAIMFLEVVYHWLLKKGYISDDWF